MILLCEFDIVNDAFSLVFVCVEYFCDDVRVFIKKNIFTLCIKMNVSVICNF